MTKKELVKNLFNNKGSSVEPSGVPPLKLG